MGILMYNTDEYTRLNLTKWTKLNIGMEDSEDYVLWFVSMNCPTFIVLRRISLENNYDKNPTHPKLPVREPTSEKSRKLIHWFSSVEGR